MLKLELTEVNTLVTVLNATTFQGKDMIALASLMEKLMREHQKLVKEMEKKQK
tara:strand:- start:1389 stop:1547 length:159 start_codon:yes stop_codon:yes gene_type:complete